MRIDICQDHMEDSSADVRFVSEPNMPSPALMKQLAITKFQGFRIQLPPQASVAPGGLKLATALGGTALAAGPVGISSPVGISPNVVRAGVTIGAHRAGPAPTAIPMPVPPALFLAASNSVGDMNLQKSMHDGYTQLFDKLTDAIKYAWDMFRSQAFFIGIRINGPIAIGGPGCLTGPAIDQFIRTAPPVVGLTGWWATVRDEFAHGFQNSWQDWQKGVTVPGLPWYPAFAAVPAPQAPPMPNIPTPLITCVSSGKASMTGPALKANLAQQLSGKMDYSAQFSEAMAAMVDIAFAQWLAAQQVTNVQGKGPVPAYAPPYVPVGPVVGGDNLTTPGHLLT